MQTKRRPIKRYESWTVPLARSIAFAIRMYSVRSMILLIVVSLTGGNLGLTEVRINNGLLSYFIDSESIDEKEIMPNSYDKTEKGRTVELDTNGEKPANNHPLDKLDNIPDKKSADFLLEIHSTSCRLNSQLSNTNSE